jgi:hypothetical protein
MAMPSLTGRVLKKEWRVGKLLGAGACAEVYEVERVAVTARSGSRAAAAAAASTTSLVIKVAPVPPPAAKGKKANGDAKRAADTLFAEHLLYANVLNRSPRRFGREVAYGESDGVRYLVLERLGASLGDEVARLAAAGKRLDPKALAAVGLDVLASLEALHAARYVYVDGGAGNE